MQKGPSYCTPEIPHQDYWHCVPARKKTPQVRRVGAPAFMRGKEPLCSPRLTYTRINRQSEIKRCARPGIRSEPQTAAMRFNDRTADRQAHAGALLLGSEERVE